MNPDDGGPFKKDTLESKNSRSQPQSLSEKDFIQEGASISSLPLWLWLFLATALISLIWGLMGWYQGVVQKEKGQEPFLDVTNREFSVFLWQFPSFLRVNVSKKTGYLPGFLSNKETMDLQAAEELVSAPPDLLFLYHTWRRLLAADFPLRPIAPAEFDEFLAQVEEWQPQNWKKAPEAYIQLVKTRAYQQIKNLQALPEASLPFVVRQAFQGWKNYYKEGPQINALTPTMRQVIKFLEKHPTYARNYWRNIERVANQEVAGIHYLHFSLRVPSDEDEKVPAEQLASFLKVALFNAEQAEKEEAEARLPSLPFKPNLSPKS